MGVVVECWGGGGWLLVSLRSSLLSVVHSLSSLLHHHSPYTPPVGRRDNIFSKQYLKMVNHEGTEWNSAWNGVLNEMSDEG